MCSVICELGGRRGSPRPQTNQNTESSVTTTMKTVTRSGSNSSNSSNTSGKTGKGQTKKTDISREYVDGLLGFGTVSGNQVRVNLNLS